MSGGLQLSNVAFVVSKVDSVKIIKKNIRIINHGLEDSAGRLEVKLDGRWNTIRASDDMDVNKVIAKAACRFLG